MRWDNLLALILESLLLILINFGGKQEQDFYLVYSMSIRDRNIFYCNYLFSEKKSAYRPFNILKIGYHKIYIFAYKVLINIIDEKP